MHVTMAALAIPMVERPPDFMGDHDTVARRIVDWFADEIGTYMLALQPFEAEWERSAAMIMPRVDALVEEN